MRSKKSKNRRGEPITNKQSRGGYSGKGGKMKTNMRGLIPESGNVPRSFVAAVSHLQRPYFPISADVYNELMNGEFDFYTYKGKLCTFGTADQGYALMPYIT